MSRLKAEEDRVTAPNRTSLPCGLCGVLIERRPSELKKSSSRGNVFCSRQHYFEFNRGTKRTRAKTFAMCDHCGVSFPRMRSQKRGEGTYCDTTCAAAARGISNAVLPVGTRRVIATGYVNVKTDDGWRPEHRVVMEESLRRPLRRFENVHHLNGDRGDNRPENLELWVKSQPAGQRPENLVAWAREILALYGGDDR